MCFGAPSAPKPPPPAEPLKQVDQATSQSRDEMTRRMALARGLQSTWTRGLLNGGQSSANAAAPKASNLGGTK